MNRNYCISNLKNENLTDYNRVSKVSALFDSQPELLYKNPYINFLREFRIRHLDLNIPELYHEAANAWIQLSKKEKLGFRCLDVSSIFYNNKLANVNIYPDYKRYKTTKSNETKIRSS